MKTPFGGDPCGDPSLSSVFFSQKIVGTVQTDPDGHVCWPTAGPYRRSTRVAENTGLLWNGRGCLRTIVTLLADPLMDACSKLMLILYLVLVDNLGRCDLSSISDFLVNLIIVRL